MWVLVGVLRADHEVLPRLSSRILQSSRFGYGRQWTSVLVLTSWNSP